MYIPSFPDAVVDVAHSPLCVLGASLVFLQNCLVFSYHSFVICSEA